MRHLSSRFFNYPIRLLFRLLAVIGSLLGASALLGQPFALTDSGPQSSDFQNRFLGSYGVNSAIEPTIESQDRKLYEKIAPFLREDPARAIAEVEATGGKEMSSAFHFLLGNLYYQIDNLEAAEPQLLQALEKFPDFRRAHRTLGLIYIRKERFPEAIRTWLQVITLGGGDAQSYGLLGYAYLSEEKYASALPAYRMARMFKPDSRDFRRGEAQALLATDEPRQAIALFEELIAEEPETREYWLLQANAFLRLQRDSDAIANLEIALSLEEEDPGTRFLLADLYLRQANHVLALKHYQQAIHSPGEFAVERALKPLQYLIGAGLTAEAKDYLQEVDQVLPEELTRKQTALLAVSRARVAEASGDSEKARELLLPVVTNDPLNADALLLLAGNFQETEEYDQAEFYLQRVLSFPDRKGDALIALGRLEVTRGNLKKALGHLRTARDLAPRAGLSRYIESIEAAL